MIALDPADQPLVTALTEPEERRRVVAGWAEITAERRAEYHAYQLALMEQFWSRLENETNG